MSDFRYDDPATVELSIYSTALLPARFRFVCFDMPITRLIFYLVMASRPTVYLSVCDVEVDPIVIVVWSGEAARWCSG